ncbi:MAG: hypothetical protein KBB39_01705 [Phycicoccus sp.]|nr:hypothetical protein [Phycicoccus sp.]
MSAAASLPTTVAERRAGGVLQAIVLGSGLWVILLSAACVPLSAVGQWQPAVVGPVAALLAVLAFWAVRQVPSVSLPLWSAGALTVISVGVGLWLGATHAEQVLPRRDSASNLQAAISLADHGLREVPIEVAAYGGPDVVTDPGVRLASPAFFAVGTEEQPVIQPQFVIGPAALYSIGVWVGGAPGAMVLPAALTALGLLAIGLLTARTVGPRWAAVAAGGTALLYPVVHVGRTTYSEPLAMVTLAAGLLALVAAAGDEDSHRGAVVSGLLIGGTAFVRIDGLRETVLLVPYLTVLLARGERWPLRVGAAAGLGTVAALGAAWAQSEQYLGSIAASLVPLAAMGILIPALAWAALSFADRGWHLPAGLSRRLPALLGGLVLLVGCYLASRPLWQVVRQSPDDPGARYVAGMQARQGLVVDGGRTYAEDTVAWLSWYVGPVALALALLMVAAGFTRLGAAWRDQERLPDWAGALVVVAGSSVLTLLRPGITPDHPWATRRLLIALPLVVVAVVAAAAWVARRLVRSRPMAYAVVAVGALLASFAVPAALATAPHVSERVEQGSLRAVGQVCAAFGPGDVALMIDSRSANEWPEVLRNCGVPALSATAAVRRDPSGLQVLVRRLKGTLATQGKHLVVVAADADTSISDLGVIPVEAVAITVQEQDHRLEERADALVALPIRVWVGRP